MAHTQQVCSPPDSPFPLALEPAAEAQAVTTFAWPCGSASGPTSLPASGLTVERPCEALAASTVPPHSTQVRKLLKSASFLSSHFPSYKLN